MAATNRRGQGISASDLTSWIKEQVSEVIEDETETIAHGGTALTLLGVKGYTKDVDFGFRLREDFDRFSQALKRMGYEIAFDSQPGRGEVFVRLESPPNIIDVVDLRFPTWNNWRLTGAVLNRAISIPLGRVSVIRPDVSALFLFKTYPLREIDLDDLRSIIHEGGLDEARVVTLFDEQDETYRQELMESEIEYEPLINVLEMRARFACSLASIREREVRTIPAIARHARAKFEELDLELDLGEFLRLVRSETELVDWDRLVGEEGLEDLRKELAM